MHAHVYTGVCPLTVPADETSSRSGVTTIVSAGDAGDSADDLDAVAATLNSRPRKTLGWRTPAEALEEYLQSSQQPSVATTG